VDRRERLENGLSAMQIVSEKYNIETHSIININDIIEFLTKEENRKKINAPEDILERVHNYCNEWGVA
jgi:orotate phosphoribosyltransferase